MGRVYSYFQNQTFQQVILLPSRKGRSVLSKAMISKLCTKLPESADQIMDGLGLSKKKFKNGKMDINQRARGKTVL